MNLQDLLSEARPFAHLLGGEERLEQVLLRFLVHAASGVADGEEDVGAGPNPRVGLGVLGIRQESDVLGTGLLHSGDP